GIKCVTHTMMGMEFPYQFAAIIRRGAALPASQSEVFFTHSDNQVRADIDVYQGEDDDVRNNHPIAKFTIEGLSPGSSGNPSVVRRDLARDGTLKGTARERARGLQKEVTIDNALAKFQREERALAQERLNQLWEGQDEDGEDVLEGEVEEEAPAGAGE